MFHATTTIVFDHFNEKSDDVKKLVDEALEKLVRDGEARAKLNCTSMGTIDTGNMQNAIYSKGPGFSTFGAAANTQPEEPIGNHEALVHAGAPYSIFVDYGTIHMPGRPFFSEAVESIKTTAEKVMGQILDGGLS